MKTRLPLDLNHCVARCLWLLFVVPCAWAHPGHTNTLAEIIGHPYTNQVSIAIEGDYRVIRANGVPDHLSGQFPNRNNPNTIREQNYSFRVPAKPKIAEKPTPYTLQPFGIALNGVVFDPGANEWWKNDRSTGWQVEALGPLMKLGMDMNNAHVQPNGAYHYHGVPSGLYSRFSGGSRKMVLLGWAADGFPIYGHWGYTDPSNASSTMKKIQSSYRLKKGTRTDGPPGNYNGSYVQDWEYVAGSGDLDECNGRVGVTPESPKEGVYHYYVTVEFPFISRQFKGTPDPSFERRGPPGGGLGDGDGKRPPPPHSGGPGGPPPPPPQ